MKVACTNKHVSLCPARMVAGRNRVADSTHINVTVVVTHLRVQLSEPLQFVTFLSNPARSAIQPRHPYQLPTLPLDATALGEHWPPLEPVFTALYASSSLSILSPSSSSDHSQHRPAISSWVFLFMFWNIAFLLTFSLTLHYLPSFRHAPTILFSVTW
jgi:hypothetical protein